MFDSVHGRLDGAMWRNPEAVRVHVSMPDDHVLVSRLGTLRPGSQRLVRRPQCVQSSLHVVGLWPKRAVHSGQFAGGRNVCVIEIRKIRYLSIVLEQLVLPPSLSLSVFKVIVERPVSPSTTRFSHLSFFLS